MPSGVNTDFKIVASFSVKVSIPAEEGYDYVRVTIRTSDFKTYIDHASVKPLITTKRVNIDKKADSYFQKSRKAFMDGYVKRDLEVVFQKTKAPNHYLIDKLAALQK